MRIYLSPQINPMVILYSFGNDIVNVTIDGVTDVFDFTSFPNGKIDTQMDIETDLVINPIMSAERVDGILSIQLLNCVGEDATHEENFPVWQEV